MRVESGKKKRAAEELDFSEIVFIAKHCSYNYASRYLNVTLESLKRFVEKNYPDLHKKITENGLNRKTMPYYCHPLKKEKDFKTYAK